MGLDMYLYRQRAGERPVAEVLNDPELSSDDYTLLTKGVTQDEWFRRIRAGEHERTPDGIEVAYWRKANAIHAWFVDTFQAGRDECQYSDPIGREALAGLVERCRRILAGSAPASLLPVREGFFFGGYEYDEEYMNKLRETIEQLAPLIAERNRDVFIYMSSW